MLSFNDFVVLWASENDPAENNVPYDAVEAVLTDGAADVIYQDAVEVNIEPVGAMVGGNTRRGSNDGKRQAFIRQMCNVSITVPLRAFAGAGEAPFYDPVLQAGNLEPEVDGASVIYTKKTRNTPAMTVYKIYRDLLSDDWRLRIATGVRGNITINIDVNEEPTVTFEGTGQYSDLTAPAEFIDPTTGQIALLKDGTTAVTARTTGTFLQADQDPMTCTNIDASLDDGDGFDAAILFQTLDMNLGFGVADLTPVQGETTRRRGILTRGQGETTTGSASVVDYDPEFLTEVVAGITESKEYALAIGLQNGQGSIDIAAPKMQLLREAEADNSGAIQYDIPYRLNGDWGTRATADNELTITYDVIA